MHVHVHNHITHIHTPVDLDANDDVINKNDLEKERRNLTLII